MLHSGERYAGAAMRPGIVLSQRLTCGVTPRAEMAPPRRGLGAGRGAVGLAEALMEMATAPVSVVGGATRVEAKLVPRALVGCALAPWQA